MHTAQEYNASPMHTAPHRCEPTPTNYFLARSKRTHPEAKSYSLGHCEPTTLRAPAFQGAAGPVLPQADDKPAIPSCARTVPGLPSAAYGLRHCARSFSINRSIEGSGFGIKPQDLRRTSRVARDGAWGRSDFQVLSPGTARV